MASKPDSFNKQYQTSADYFYKKDLGLGKLGSDLTFGKANQLGAITKVISSGQGAAELGLLQRQWFEGVPNEHWDEIRRLSNLTGVKPSMHAPIMDTMGRAPTGEFTEEQRKLKVDEMFEVLEKAHRLSDKDRVPVNFHASSLGTQEQTFGDLYRKDLFTPKEAEAYNKQYFEGQEAVKPTEKFVSYGIDTVTGKAQPMLFQKKKYLPTKEGEKYHEQIFTPDESIDMLNRTTWDNEIMQVLSYDEKINEIERHIPRLQAEIKARNDVVQSYATLEKKGLLNDPQKIARYNQLQQEKQALEGQSNMIQQNIGQLSHDMRLSLENMHHNLQQTLPNIKDEKQKEIYEEIINKMGKQNIQFKERERNIWEKFDKTKTKEEQNQVMQELAQLEKERVRAVVKETACIGHFTKDNEGNKIPVSEPQRFVPLKDFEIDKTSKTFADAAFKAFDKFGEKAPVIVIENPPVGQFGIARADELKEMVETARKNFAEKLVKEKRIKENEANKIAEDMIGATWDVGHINLLKSMGYSDEDIEKETQKIAKYVKHLHLTDNLGRTDSHLPPGMGNVPFDKIMSALNNAGFEGRRIIEAGQFVEDFKTSPFPPTLSYFDSPLYATNMPPYWKGSQEVPTLYSMGYGEMLPQQHMGLYGAGFSTDTLPRELGGQQGKGGKSAFSGTPEE